MPNQNATSIPNHMSPKPHNTGSYILKTASMNVFRIHQNQTNWVPENKGSPKMG